MYEAIILVGGESSRIGKNKALLLINGVSVIQRIIDVAETVVDNIIIVLKKDVDDKDILRLRGDNIRLVFEKYDFKNPLAGIYTGLNNSSFEYSLVLPCDTPFLNRDVIRYLLNICDGYDLTIPRWENGYLEPLCAVYNKKSVLEAIDKVEDLQDVEIKRIFNRLSKIKYVPVEELREFDKDLLTFYNINTVDDYEEALRICRAQ